MRKVLLNAKAFWRLVVNGITTSRLACGLYGLFFAAQQGFISLHIVIVFGVGGLTDLLDGFLARLFKAETDFGYWYDKAVDKIFIGLSLITFYNFSPLDLGWGRVQVWLLVFIELLISAAGINAATSASGTRGKKHKGDNYIGKAKIAVEVLALCVWGLAGITEGIAAWQVNALIVGATILAALSLPAYWEESHKK